VCSALEANNPPIPAPTITILDRDSAIDEPHPQREKVMDAFAAATAVPQ